MYIYAIGTDTKTKIGISQDVNARLATIQTGNPETLRIHYAFKIDKSRAAKLESHIHKEYNHHKIRGEWFNLDECEAVKILSYFAIVKDSIIL